MCGTGETSGLDIELAAPIAGIAMALDWDWLDDTNWTGVVVKPGAGWR